MHTCNDELQVEGVLASAVAGNAGINASVAGGDWLDDQRMDTILPHQHFVGTVRSDCLPVKLPDEVWCRKAADLQGITWNT